MSKLESALGDTGRDLPAAFCDTFLFMLMLAVFCEGGHAGGPPRPAYSTRCRIHARMFQPEYNALNHIRKPVGFYDRV